MSINTAWASSLGDSWIPWICILLLLVYCSRTFSFRSTESNRASPGTSFNCFGSSYNVSTFVFVFFVEVCLLCAVKSCMISSSAGGLMRFSLSDSTTLSRLLPNALTTRCTCLQSVPLTTLSTHVHENSWTHTWHSLHDRGHVAEHVSSWHMNGFLSEEILSHLFHIITAKFSTCSAVTVLCDDRKMIKHVSKCTCSVCMSFLIMPLSSKVNYQYLNLWKNKSVNILHLTFEWSLLYFWSLSLEHTVSGSTIVGSFIKKDRQPAYLQLLLLGLLF